MTPQQFEAEIKRKAAQVKTLIENKLPRQTGKTAIRFINGNFKAQGWQGTGFSQWKKRKDKSTRRILIKSGKLRRDTYFNIAPAVVTLRNDLPYAAIHNNGGTIKATATVKAHTRKESKRKVAGKRKKQIVKAHTVKTHTRNMDIQIPQRQFFPTVSSPSPVLENAIKRNIEREINKLFKI